MCVCQKCEIQKIFFGMAHPQKSVSSLSPKEHLKMLSMMVDRVKLAKIVGLCLLWNCLSSGSGVLQKAILKKLPFPMTLALVYFLSTAVYSFPLLWWKNLQNGFANYLDKKLVLTFLIPLAIGKVLTELSSHYTIWKLEVSYAHTIKSSIPIFTVILCRLLFKESQPKRIYLTLILIVAGVAVATATAGPQIPYLGLIAGLLATCGQSLQNIFNKKLLKKAQIHGFQLMALLSRISCLLLIPLWVVVDLRRLVDDDAGSSHDLTSWMTIGLMGVDGLLNFSQNIVAFTLLSLVAPVTYGVAGTSKRICVIMFSFVSVPLINYDPREPSPVNIVGISMTILGVFLYSIFRAQVKAASRQNSSNNILPIHNAQVNVEEENLRELTDDLSEMSSNNNENTTILLLVPSRINPVENSSKNEL